MRKSICLKCEKEFEISRGAKGLFCSQDCMYKSRKKGTEAEDGFKRCSYCLEVKPTSEFYNSKLRPDGFRGHCIRCEKNFRRKLDFGITIDEYEKLAGKCEICGSRRNIHLDHNHETGEIRGALCINCNIGLGNFRDNIKLLKRAIKYLRY